MWFATCVMTINQLNIVGSVNRLFVSPWLVVCDIDFVVFMF